MRKANQTIFVRDITRVFFFMFVVFFSVKILAADIVGRDFISISNCLNSIKNQTSSKSLTILTDKPTIVSGRTSSGNNFVCEKKRTATKGIYIEGYYFTKTEGKNSNLGSNAPSLFKVLLILIVVFVVSLFGYLSIREKIEKKKLESYLQDIDDFTSSELITDYLGKKAISFDFNSSQICVLYEIKSDNINSCIIKMVDVSKVELYEANKLTQSSDKTQKVTKANSDNIKNYALTIYSEKLSNSSITIRLVGLTEYVETFKKIFELINQRLRNK